MKHSEIPSIHTGVDCDDTQTIFFFPSSSLSYYSASPEGNPHYRHLYRVRDGHHDLRGQGQTRGRRPPAASSAPECLTCQLVTTANETESEVALLLRRHHLQLKKDDGTELPTAAVDGGCLYNEVSFSPDLSHFAVDCKGPDVPRTLLYQTRGRGEEEEEEKEGEEGEKGEEGEEGEEEEVEEKGEQWPKMLSELENNSKLREEAVNMSLPKVRIIEVPLSSGYQARVKLILPPEVGLYTFATYPLLLQV